MKTIVLIAVLMFFFPDKAVGEETNSVIGGVSIPFPELTLKSRNWLPWQNRMGFGTEKISIYEWQDIFSMMLYQSVLHPKLSLEWRVDSRYPITSSGPRRDVVGTGLVLTWKF